MITEKGLIYTWVGTSISVSRVIFGDFDSAHRQDKNFFQIITLFIQQSILPTIVKLKGELANFFYWPI